MVWVTRQSCCSSGFCAPVIQVLSYWQLIHVASAAPSSAGGSLVTFPLLQHGVPPVGDSPSRTSAAWVLTISHSSSETAPASVPAMGYSPSGTGYYNVEPHEFTCPDRETCPTWTPLSLVHRSCQKDAQVCASCGSTVSFGH